MSKRTFIRLATSMMLCCCILFGKDVFAQNKSFTVNGVSFEMVYVEGGSFMMGSTDAIHNECQYYDVDDGWPSHKVSLDDFYIGKLEVTQELWEAVMGKECNCYYKGRKKPVCANWNDCQDFIKKLNKLTGEKFRLPSEAEWEYAAKGGKKSKGYVFSGSDDLMEVYNYGTDAETPEVGQMKPNELGIYDMTGGVSEWCQDWYGDYDKTVKTNPQGPSKGTERVVRGANWFFVDEIFPVSIRNHQVPDYLLDEDEGSRDDTMGFRICLSK